MSIIFLLAVRCFGFVSQKSVKQTRKLQFKVRGLLCHMITEKGLLFPLVIIIFGRHYRTWSQQPLDRRTDVQPEQFPTAGRKRHTKRNGKICLSTNIILPLSLSFVLPILSVCALNKPCNFLLYAKILPYLNLDACSWNFQPNIYVYRTIQAYIPTCHMLCVRFDQFSNFL